MGHNSMPYGGGPATMSASEAPGTGPGTPQLPSKYSSSEHIKAYFLKTAIFLLLLLYIRVCGFSISAIELVVHREIFTASLFYSGLLDRHWAPEGERNRRPASRVCRQASSAPLRSHMWTRPLRGTARRRRCRAGAGRAGVGAGRGVTLSGV